MKKLIMSMIIVGLTTQLYAKEGEPLEQREAERMVREERPESIEQAEAQREIAAGEPGVSLEQAEAQRIVKEKESGEYHRARGCGCR